MPALKQRHSLPPDFLRTERIEEALHNYQQATKLLEETLSPVKISPEGLSFALLVNNLALELYGTSVKEIVTQRFYRRKTIIETE